MGYETEETLFEIAKSLKLSYAEYTQLTTDVYDMRGNEWWDEVFSNCRQELIDKFYAIIKSDYDEEEDEED